jgi:hypothetical protein
MMAYPAIPVIKKKYDIYLTHDDTTGKPTGNSTERYFDLPQYIAAEKYYQKITTDNTGGTTTDIITETDYSNLEDDEKSGYTLALSLTDNNTIANAFEIDIEGIEKPTVVPPKSISYSIFVDNDSDFKCDKMVVDTDIKADVLAS